MAIVANAALLEQLLNREGALVASPRIAAALRSALPVMRDINILEDHHLRRGSVFFFTPRRLLFGEPEFAFEWERFRRRAPITDDMVQMLEDIAAEGWRR